MNTDALAQFLTARVNEESGQGYRDHSVQELRRTLDQYGVAKGTLDRYPTPYAQGVLEGIRLDLCNRAVRFAWHEGYLDEWKVVIPDAE